MECIFWLEFKIFGESVLVSCSFCFTSILLFLSSKVRVWSCWTFFAVLSEKGLKIICSFWWPLCCSKVENKMSLSASNSGSSIALFRWCSQVQDYELVIAAIDNGVPALTSSTLVKIELLDINDSPPQFSNTNFTATIQVFASRQSTCIFRCRHRRDT